MEQREIKVWCNGAMRDELESLVRARRSHLQMRLKTDAEWSEMAILDELIVELNQAGS